MMSFLHRPREAFGTILVQFLLLLLLLTCSKTLADKSGCSAIKHAFGAMGLQKSLVPKTMISGEKLRVCSRSFTCCSRAMEERLEEKSKGDFDKLMIGEMRSVRETFITKTLRFDQFFKELLRNARKDLNTMFVETYGLIYKQNADIFTRLFDNLQSYYVGRNVDILERLDSFFSELLKKMFVLINSSFQFDEDYLNCLGEQMDQLKPFGDVPRKLSVQLKRAFIAARTFVQGLSVGRDVILAVSKMQQSPSCSAAFTKLVYCPLCRGLESTKPCNNYCLNVLKGCLAYQAELQADWNSYLDSLLKLAERLEGPFNIEQVLDPIDVKLSDAIMNFQENSDMVTKRVYQVCGQPARTRTRREASPKYQFPKSSSNSHDKMGFSGVGRGASNEPRPTTAAGTNLDRLVQGVKDDIAPARGMWHRAPSSVCGKLTDSVENSFKCWNGLGKAKYTTPVVKDGVAGQKENAEVYVDARKPSSVVRAQILQLRLMGEKLKKAYQGLDVEYMDSQSDIPGAEDMEIGSGSGSGLGPGSGDDVIGSGSGVPSSPTDVIVYLPEDNQIMTTPPSYDPHGSKGGRAAASLTFVAFLTVISRTL